MLVARAKKCEGAEQRDSSERAEGLAGTESILGRDPVFEGGLQGFIPAGSVAGAIAVSCEKALNRRGDRGGFLRGRGLADRDFAHAASGFYARPLRDGRR